MIDQCERYHVEYHTTPSPGLNYYAGTLTVYANDEQQAQERALKELKLSGFPPSLIVITSITRKFT